MVLKYIMALKKYKQKRDLNKSGEPEGKVKSSGKKPIFVIHKHYASHLHWDLRLEINGVLKSWAVPKIPPEIKGTKRLAIQVEDHPIGYAKFEGIIPEGNYGAGKVEIWDKGKYELIEKDKKKIEFKLYGKKLKGNYVLVKTDYLKNKKSWLFIKI
jgi:DNA ligase D-like protein (predicted 3'-phosphoesterase)